jgi:hypothetical protein
LRVGREGFQAFRLRAAICLSREIYVEIGKWKWLPGTPCLNRRHGGAPDSLEWADRRMRNRRHRSVQQVARVAAKALDPRPLPTFLGKSLHHITSHHQFNQRLAMCLTVRGFYLSLASDLKLRSIRSMKGNERLDLRWQVHLCSC